MGGTTVTGGYLSGTGSQTVGTGGASFLGTTVNNGATLLVNAATSLTNVNSSGAISVPAGQTLTWTGGSNYLGTLTANGTVNTSGWTSSGVITVNNGGTLANAASNLVLGGGSRTTISNGGTLGTASGTTIELNGGLLTNNGTQTGTLDVNYGSNMHGSLMIRPTQVIHLRTHQRQRLHPSIRKILLGGVDQLLIGCHDHLSGRNNASNQVPVKISGTMLPDSPSTPRGCRIPHEQCV